MSARRTLISSRRLRVRILTRERPLRSLLPQNVILLRSQFLLPIFFSLLNLLCHLFHLNIRYNFLIIRSKPRILVSPGAPFKPSFGLGGVVLPGAPFKPSFGLGGVVIS